MWKPKNLAERPWIEFEKPEAYKIDDLPILALGFADRAMGR